MVSSFSESGAYFGMKGGAISQLSRRSKETIKGDKKLGRILVTPDPSVFSWGYSLLQIVLTNFAYLLFEMNALPKASGSFVHFLR
jgi:hypothetical protein